ncbi:VCBS domain-containing protein, partial [Pseudomonas sp. NW5]|uniref:beta strand repeat-containing protein n=1 Tax=Pseudomonas sp. NW5 TaxID=2934934 RepID=UPI0020200915
AEDAAVLEGQLVATDVDTGAELTFATEEVVDGFMLNADGSYTFDAANAAYQSLAEGDELVLTVPYSVTDGIATAESTLTITVTGTNDAPVAEAATAAVAEDAAVLEGQLVATDVDTGAELTFAQVGEAVAGLTINADGTYTFDAANAAYQSLAEGEALILEVPYSVTDGIATAESTLTITVTGTNDAPVAEAATVAVAEDVLLEGQLVATDVDTGAELTFATEEVVDGFMLNADGSYTFDAANAAYQSLAEGEERVLTVPYSVTDGIATVESTLTITVTGTNDVPVVTGVIAAQTLKSANNVLFAGASVSDIDGVNSAELTTDAVLQVSSSVAEDEFAFAGTNVAFVANLVTVGGVGVATFTQAEGVLTVTFGSDDPATVINAQTVNTVLQALQLNADPDSGERAITLTVTDALGGQSQAVQTLVTSLPENFTAPTITSFDGEKIIAAQAGATAVDVTPDAEVAFVAKVGLENVDGLTLTLTLSGDTANSDVLALPTALEGSGSVAVIGGRLVYQTSPEREETSTQLNLGTVSGGTNGQPLLITLAANPNAEAGDYDAALGLVLNSVTFDADGVTVVEGPRTLTATLGGLVGVEEVSASTTLVVTAEGELNLTTGVDTLGDAQFINLFSADLDGETQTLNTVTGSGGGSDALTGGATAFDTLTATLNADAGAVTITDVDRLNLTAVGDSGALDFAGITNADFAMQVVVEGSGKLNLTSVANVESIDAGAATGALTVDFADGETATVTTGSGDTSITADDLAASGDAPAVAAEITVAVGSGDGAITLSGSADFNLTGALSSNVSGAGTTGDLSIASVVGSAGVTVVAGEGNLTVADNALTGEGTPLLTVNAAAMLDDNSLTISGAGDVVVTGALADVNLAGTRGTVTVTTSDGNVNTGDSVETTVTLGTGATATVNTDGSGVGNATVNIDALSAVAYLIGEDELTLTNVDLNVSGDADIVNITDLSADVNATGFSGGTLNLTTVAGANIDVSGGASDINLLGAAELVTVDAKLTFGEDTLTIGQAASGEDEAVAFQGDVTVTGLGTSGSGAVDAANLAGALDVTTVGSDSGSVTITLGAGVTEARLKAGNTSASGSTVEATDFTNTLTLTGLGDVVVTGFNATIDADGVPSGDGVEGIASGDLAVTLAANANATIIAGDHDILTVTGGDTGTEGVLNGTRSTITIDAAAMTLVGPESVGIVINASSGASGGFNSNVVIDKAPGAGSNDSAIEINLSGLDEEASTATVDITTGVLGKGAEESDDGDVLDITLGTSQLVTIEGTTGIVGAGNNGRVEIDASSAVAADFDGDEVTTNVQITLQGSADFTLSDVSADVNATGVTGNVVINAIGATNDLTLSGGAGNDEIFAGSGDDTINGGAGDDIIEGGVGDDTIDGGAGDDTIEGGAGVDLLTGGAGVDTFVFNQGDTGFGAGNRDVITDFQISEDYIDLSAITGITSVSNLQISYATAADGLTKTAIIGYDENGATSGGLVEIALTGLPLNDQLSANEFIFSTP